MRSFSALLVLQPLFLASAWTGSSSDHSWEGGSHSSSPDLTLHKSSQLVWSSSNSHHTASNSHYKLNTNNRQNKLRRRRTIPILKQEFKHRKNGSSPPAKQVYDHEEHNHMPPFVDQLPPGPFFDIERSGNVTALVDQSARLNCRVNQIGNRTVSWLRHRDLHLLTVGRYTYTSDQRFRAEHIAGSEDWPLTIKFAQVRDSGLYECQVSTTPPIKHSLWLNVVEPRTRVLGGPDVYINRGSSINLTCVVDYTPRPPDFVIWKHNNKIISYDSERGGVNVVTEKGPHTSTNLLIRGASSRDSGTYSCSPSSAPPSSVTVHILNASVWNFHKSRYYYYYYKSPVDNLGRLVSESAFKREDPGSNPAADMVDAARNTAWDLGEHPAAMQHGGHSPQALSITLVLTALAWVAASFSAIVG
ncbi:Immunoglobulin I-set [Trinorchestia longiramus]|nr:Immunoglobulin I-set [Trinorchestia longiramus]